MASAFTSKPFSFIVEGQSFVVHSGLVSECSEPLDRMINGHLTEAQQGFAILEDIDTESFVRVVRWLYSRDYPALGPFIAPKEDPAIEPAPAVNDEDWSSWATAGKRKKKDRERKHDQSERTTLKESFISLEYDIGDQGSTLATPAARSNKSPDEDYTEVFLCHARIYVFADKYDINPLRLIALKKLQMTLAIFTLYPDRVSDVIQLLKYVYDNTDQSTELDYGQNSIRTMLVHYLGSDLVAFKKHGEIRSLLSANQEMLDDFLGMLAQRML